MGSMAEEKYISASDLQAAINSISVCCAIPYSNDPVGQAIGTQVSRAVEQALDAFKYQLSSAVMNSATKEGPCFLCKSPRPECESLPLNPHQ